MSRLLAELLEADQSALRATLDQLETDSGHPNADARLLSELITALRHKKRELGLDPTDTNGRELYYALQELAALHDGFLNRQVGELDYQNTSQLARKYNKLLARLGLPLDVWVLKPSVAKKLFKGTPPKKALKLLGYKSIDSMLKREPVSNVYLAAQLSESAAWKQRFIHSYKQLNPGDFEKRMIVIRPLPSAKLESAGRAYVARHRHNLVSIKELGAIYILPLELHTAQGTTLVMLAMLIRAINEIRSLSVYLKLEQVRPRFGLTVAKAVSGAQPSIMAVSGRQLPWPIIQQYLYTLHAGEHPEILTPHLQLEDLAWSKPEDHLYRAEPALKFWEDMDWVAANDGGVVVPLNLMDNAISFYNQLPYGQQSARHFQKSLSNRLYLRYLSERPMSSNLLDSLDYALVGASPLGGPLGKEAFI